MKFSKQIQNRSKSPTFLNKTKAPLSHSCEINLSKLGVDLIVYFNTVKKEELEVEMLNYFTDYQGEYLGVIDAYIQLIQNRPIEAIDRFPIKELDYFLRDDQSISAFSGYSQEVYEILSIGESIKSKIYGEKKIGFNFNPEMDGDFYSLSTSEQYELLEELFAYFVYNKYDIEYIDVVDIDENIIQLSFINDEIEQIIKEKLSLPDRIQITC